jgi:hypothetical protein
LAKRTIVKPTSLELNGDIYDLKLDFTAMKDFEDAAGKSIFQFLQPVFAVFDDLKSTLLSGDHDMLEIGITAIEELIKRDTINFNDLAVLLWACLGGEDSGKTVREAGRLIHVGNIAEVASKLWQAVQEALPKSEGEAVADGEEPKN